MIRYNAAHPGAERDIFPHLAARKPQLVAYTATSWRKLLKAPRGWTGKVRDRRRLLPVLPVEPHVDVVPHRAGDRRAARREPRRARAQGPLSADEDTWLREFGKAVHG